MTWQFLILISVFLYSISVLLQKTLLNRTQTDPLSLAVVFQILTGLTIGLFGWLFSNMSLPQLKPLLFNLILMTLLYGFGNIFVFKSLKRLQATRFTVIFSSRALFTILASSLILKESLVLKQLLGTSLLLAGIVLANIKAAKLTFSRHQATALLAAVCFGLAITNDRFLLKSFQVYPYATLGFIIPGLFIAFLNPSLIKTLPALLSKQTFPQILLLSTLYAAAAITFFFALQISPNSSQVASINLTSVITTVLLAIIFLRERDNLGYKILGAFSSFLGLFLVS